MVPGSNSGRGNDCPARLLLNTNQGSSQAEKRAGRDVVHSLPPIVEAKNDWSFTSAPLMCLNDVENSFQGSSEPNCLQKPYNAMHKERS
jgi:hypothetical protein